MPDAPRHDARNAEADASRFTLPYRPPFDWAAMLAFLSRRTVLGVEAASLTATTD